MDSGMGFGSRSWNPQFGDSFADSHTESSRNTVATKSMSMREQLPMSSCIRLEMSSSLSQQLFELPCETNPSSLDVPKSLEQGSQLHLCFLNPHYG